MGGVVRNGCPVPDRPDRAVLSAGRTIPRPGDIVIIECGKHAGMVAQVTGRTWNAAGTLYTACDARGGYLGQYEASELTILA